MAVTRISGMASGMDIDAIVKKLMTAEKTPLNKMNQQKQLLEWKRDNYRETSTKLVTFLNDKLANLSLSSAISAQKATVTGNTTAVSASATSTASGTLDIAVQNLATSATVKSTSGAGAHAGSDLLSTVYTGSETSIQINNTSISIDSTDTIDSFIKKINSSLGADVTAVYDASSGKMSLTNKTTGSKDLTFSGGALSSFGLDSSVTPTAGTDAKLTINGLSVTQSSNQFTMNGVNLTLNSVTPSGQSSQVTVTPDTDKLVSSVQSFVDSYNDVLSLLNTKTNEERYTKYAPLTDEQKESMSDDEVTLWESKAKSGMLKNDSILQQTISNMRSAIVQGVTLSDGSKINFSQLGITTGSYESRGKLILDTEKLKTSIESNPNIVNEFFGTQDKTTTLTNKYTEQDGMIAKLKKISKTALESLASTAGTSKVSSDANSTFLANSIMGTQLSSLTTRISDFNSKLNTIETNYYSKFTAMETAINKYNSQASSLSGLS